MPQRATPLKTVLRAVLAFAALASSACAGAPVVLVLYTADALPAAPWELVSNGPPTETSQHTVSVDNGVLSMIDTASLAGNTLGYMQHVSFGAGQVIDVAFRARVLSGQSAIGDRAPFEVWLYNGTVRADLSVGPSSLTSLGRGGVNPHDVKVILNRPVDGTSWHDYRYTLDPAGIQWWIDQTSLGSAPASALVPNITSADTRINMMISSAAGNVQLDSLTVTQTRVHKSGALFLSCAGALALMLVIGAARRDRRRIGRLKTAARARREPPLGSQRLTQDAQSQPI